MVLLGTVDWMAQILGVDQAKRDLGEFRTTVEQASAPIALMSSRQMALQRASLRVQEVQEKLNFSVEKFGPRALQTRRTALELADAQLTLGRTARQSVDRMVSFGEALLRARSPSQLLLTVLGEIKEPLLDYTDRMKAAKAVTQSFSETTGAAMDKLARTPETIKAVSGAAGQAASTLMDTTGSVSGAAEATQTLQETTKPVAEAMKAVPPVEIPVVPEVPSVAAIEGAFAAPATEAIQQSMERMFPPMLPAVGAKPRVPEAVKPGMEAAAAPAAGPAGPAGGAKAGGAMGGLLKGAAGLAIAFGVVGLAVQGAAKAFEFLVSNSAVLQGVLGAFMSILGAIIDIIIATFMPMFMPFLDLWLEMIPIVQEVMNEFKPLIEILAHLVRDILTEFRPEIEMIVKAFVYLIAAGILGFFLALVGLMTLGLAQIRFWTEYGKLLWEVLVIIWQALQKFVEWINLLRTDPIEAMRQAWEFLKGVVLGVIDFLLNIDWGGIFQGILDFFASIDWGAVLRTLFDVITAVPRFFIDMWAGILTYLLNLDWGTILRGVADFLVGLPQRVFNAVLSVDWGGIGRGFGNALISAIETAMNYFIDWWNAQGEVDAGPFGKIDFFPNLPRITLPRFQRGGMIPGPVYAMLGEAGPEAVLPLNQPTRAMEVLQMATMASPMFRRALMNAMPFQEGGLVAPGGLAMAQAPVVVGPTGGGPVYVTVTFEVNVYMPVSEEAPEYSESDLRTLFGDLGEIAGQRLKAIIRRD